MIPINDIRDEEMKIITEDFTFEIYRHAIDHNICIDIFNGNEFIGGVTYKGIAHWDYDLVFGDVVIPHRTLSQVTTTIKELLKIDGIIIPVQ